MLFRSRLQDIDRDKAGRFLAALIDDADARGAFFAETGPVERTDLTDGLRVEFAGNRIVHLRPSGNAPEFRVYAQADTVELARALVSAYVARVGQAIA